MADNRCDRSRDMNFRQNLAKHLWVAIFVLAFNTIIATPSATASEAITPFSLKSALKNHSAETKASLQRHLEADLKIFTDRAAKLQRLCEGALDEDSYLDRLSRTDILHNHETLRPIYRFWNLFSVFFEDLARIGNKYEVPLSLNHEHLTGELFAGYTLGMASKLATVVTVSELMHFLAKRGNLEDLLNETNSEFSIVAGSLSKRVRETMKAGNLAHLYRFRISYLETLRNTSRSQLGKTFPDSVLAYLEAHKSFLDSLSRKVASDPTWKFLSRSLINASLELILPAQKQIFTWIGDTRIKSRKSRLISQQQLIEFGNLLEPGDIIIGRQDWYLSNIFLPGFWPHAILYIGTPAEISATFDSDPEIIRWCRRNDAGNFSELLAKHYPKAAAAWKSPGKTDKNPRRMIEAISDGIVLSSLYEALHCDYVAAVRPRLKKIDKARAILLAFSYYGREYDFHFSFNTEQALVCTELITKAYVRNDNSGLRFPMVKSLGKYGIPADSIVKTFAENRDKPDRQLDFVAFLRGLPSRKTAVFADAKEFAESYRWGGGLKSSNTR